MSALVIRKKAQTNLQDLANYIKGVLILKQQGWWDYYVQPHWQCMTRNGPSIDPAHGGPGFFPWHREFLLILEKSIQSPPVLNDPNFALPYWDWAADAATGNPAEQLLWTASYMGGAGQPGLPGDPVTTGPFAKGQWTTWQPPSSLPLPPIPPPPPILGTDSGSLSRTLDGTLPDQSEINAALANAQYTVFEQAAEVLHGAVHMWVGGDMATPASPNDPVFFLHHCNMDRIWAIWQGMNPSASYPASGYPLGQNLDDPMWPWNSIPNTQWNWTTTPADMLQYIPLGYAYDTDVMSIASVQFQGVYLRMDGSGMKVNCQYGAGTYEKFNLVPQSDGSVAIASLQFPGAYLYMDGSGVTQPSGTGGGTVNCQYGVGTYETFNLIPSMWQPQS